MAGNGMCGTPPPPSSVTCSFIMPSDSEEVCTFLHHNWVSPQLGSSFLHSEDPNRFAHLRNHSAGSNYPLKTGNPVASSSFHFSDPVHVKKATENEPFLVGVGDPHAKTSLKEHEICPFKKNGEASQLPSKPVPAHTSSKRSRAAEVHNLSEKRRRSEINEKMKALQNLIPNSNKTDKASMLDEAIEYLKQLQLQVQILMMRNGLSLHPMYLSGGLQPMILPQTGLHFDEGNEFQNCTSGIASSANAESLEPPTFGFSKHCSISNQSVVIPSLTNITTSDTSSSFQPSFKDALCGCMPQLLLQTTRTGKTPSPNVS